MKRIAIIGAGSWGTALAIVAARAGHQVRLWSRNADVIRSINESRVNSQYLKSVQIPSTVAPASELNEALDRAELVLYAAPSHAAHVGDAVLGMPRAIKHGAAPVRPRLAGHADLAPGLV